MPKRSSPYHGLLIVDKPGRPSACQPTSHDVVAAVRRWSGQQRIGHTGTLDPMASGVLVLCLGLATRLVEYYQGHDKQYVAEIRLGTATDSYDSTGTVTERAPIPQIEPSRLEQVLADFRGDLLQTPPAFSAIKQQGEAVHRKARRGESVEIAPRPITIRRLDLLDFMHGDTIQVRVTCSAGAYMRSLAHDLGLALDTYAHLTELRREAAGPFKLEQAHSMRAIEDAADEGHLDRMLLPMGTGLDMPELRPDPDALVRFGYGQKVSLPDEVYCQDSDFGDLTQGQLAQAVAPDGSLAGVVCFLGPSDWQENHSVWRAEKWFHGN